MKLNEKNLAKYKDGYELWISGWFRRRFFHFDTLKEAYVYYLDHFVTKQELKYVAELSGSDLYSFADNPQLIECQFDNVFNPKNHIYKVIVREDGQVCRVGIN